MKRMKVFIIAIISVLLIVSLGNVKLAHEATVIKSIGSDGKVGIKLNDLKTKYANVLCVERSTSVKHGSHGNTKDSEYYLVGTADIVGNSATLTEYTWDSKWDKIIKTRTTENDIITNNGANNTMAAILTTNNFENGYAGTNYNENGILEEEEASYGPRQLCTWGYWNTWVESLPQEWQGVFKACDKNRLKTEQENTWFNNDMAVINSISAFYTYKVKISFIEHICKDSNGNIERIGQHLILFEVEDPQVEITVEKIWDDIIYDENGNIIADNSGNRPSKLDVLVETYMTELNETDTIYDNLVHIEGEDKIVELTEENNWKSTLKLKVRAGKEGYTGLNRIYKVREVVEIQDSQNVKVDVVKVPQGEEPKVEKIFDQEKNRYVQIVTVGGEIVCKTYKEPLVAALPKVEVKEENGERILYVAGKKVVKSAYVGNVEVEDVLNVNGYKVTLKGNEKYVEPQTEEEIKNRTDTPIQNKKYAVVKQGKVLLNSSYILEDQTMIQVSDNSEYGTTEYNQYVESNIDVEDKKVDMTNTGAYVRFINKLEVVEKIPVKKVWNCSDKSKIPASVTVQLLANGEIVEGKTIVLNEGNNWYAEFTNLMKYDNSGNEIKYTIKEIEVPGFASEITGDVINGYIITNTYYDGYYEIKGTVWFDGKPGKDSTINGTLGSEDVGIPGVKVTLYYNGKQFDNSSYAYTDDNGEYTIKVNYDNSTNVYKLYDNSSKVEEKLAGTLDENKDGISDGSSYIEFEYDGMVYTTVACNAEEEKASKAREDDKARTEMDKLYSKVNTSTPEIEYYNEEIDVDGTKKTLPAIDYKDNSYWNDVNITASTKGIINSFTDYKFKNKHKEKETVKYCKGDTNGDGIEEYISSVPTADKGYNIVEGQHDCTNCTAGGHIVREVDVDVTTLNGLNLGLMEREKPDTLLDSTIHKVDVKVKGEKHTYIYNEMNPHEPNKLGKLYQDQENAIYLRQINTANIVLANKNSQEIVDVYVTYSIGIGKQMETLTTVVNSVINDYDKGYEIDNIKIETLNEENNPDTSLTRTIELSSIEIKDMGTHNRIKLDGLNMRTEGKGHINSKQVLLITYKVKPEVILSLINGDKVLNHATEIDSYETFYGKETLHAERQDTQQESNRFNKPYAGYDIDSHPGNAEIKLIDGQLKSTDNLVTVVNPETGIAKEQPEDDTDIAPPFKLEPGPYTIGGTVWEDKDIDIGTETEANTYRIGNGIKDEGDNTLANVKVTLMEVLEDGTKQKAKLYHGLGGASEEGIDAEVKTDENGNYSFATPIGASDEFAGKYSLPAGHKYELKFTYGNEDLTNATTTALGGNTSIENNGARSARDYKSTIISNANTTLYNYFKDEVANVNDKWHLDTSDNYSIAIDNMAERLNVDEDLYYGNFDEGKNISADSKPFIMTIEFTPDNESEVEVDGETLKGTEEKLKNKLEIFDFGIIERAREDLVVSKTINYMDVKLVDGSTLASGDPSNKEELNFVKVQGLRENEISKSGEAALQQRSIRQAMLEMDSEITQGATVNLEYKIIVTNNSEKDIDYTKDGGNYYKFGEIPANPENYIMSSSVDCLVTYVNKDLNPQLDETVWQSQQVNTLRSEEETGMKLISQPTKEAVTENNYVVFTTTEFKDVKPGDEPKVLQSIIANKRLTFKEENAYDIHSEILVIDGKVARTIDSVEDGKQIPKTYKSGNLVPSLEKRKVQITKETDENYRKVKTLSGEYKLSQSVEEAGLHEQDDDSVKVTITQPTGITKYITTYVIATLIGLVVIVIGIVFIKKKVLTK